MAPKTTLSWSLSLVSRQSGPAAAAAPKTAPKSNAGCREADEELQSEPTAEAIFVAFLVNAPLAFMPSLPHPSHARAHGAKRSNATATTVSTFLSPVSVTLGTNQLFGVV